MATEVKCIFQGGGAKLATLMAACEALEQLEADGQITVSEVAGTSAGSIAAFCFAHRDSTKDLRHRLIAAAGKIIDQFDRTKIGLKELLRIYFGGTIFSEKLLRECIRTVIGKDPRGDVLKISGGRIPVRVRVTDVRNGRKFTHDSEDAAADHILAEACCIPLAFRTYTSTSPYVDGGLVSNLAEPKIFSDPNARIIAFSFDNPRTYEGENLTSYLSSLVAVAIDANVEESIEKIEMAGGTVIRLPNDFGTFEFKKALEVGLADEYIEKTKREIRSKIEAALDDFQRKDRRQPDRQRLASIAQFQRSFADRVRKYHPWSVGPCAITCLAHGLGNQGKSPDVLIKDVSVVARGDSILTFRIGITRSEAYELGKDVNWTLCDKNDRELKAVHEITETVQDSESVWHSNFCLDEILPKELCPIKVHLVTSHIGILGSLLTKNGTEWMRAASHAGDEVSVQDFVIGVPKSFPPLTMVDLLENLHRATTQPSKQTEMRQNWSKGNKMSDIDLARYRRNHVDLAGFDFLGWRALNVSPGGFSGVLIERM